MSYWQAVHILLPGRWSRRIRSTGSSRPAWATREHAKKRREVVLGADYFQEEKTKTKMLTTKSNDLSLIARTHTVEGENQLVHVAL